MLKKKEIKEILSLAFGFVVFYFLSKYTLLLYISGGILLSVFIPPIAKLVLFIWKKLSFGLGWFNSKVILSLLFIALIIPLGFLFRLFNKDKMDLKKPSKNSLFKEVNYKYQKEDFEKMW